MFKEDRYGGVELGFEELVKVEPSISQFNSQFMTDGGLTTIHIADEIVFHDSKERLLTYWAGCFASERLPQGRRKGGGVGPEGVLDDGQRVGVFCIAGKDSEASVNIGVGGGGFCDELGDAGGLVERLEIAQAFGSDGLDIEYILVQEVSHLVGVAQHYDIESCADVLSIEGFIVGKQLCEHKSAENIGGGTGEKVVRLAGKRSEARVGAEKHGGADSVDSVVFIKKRDIAASAVAL